MLKHHAFVPDQIDEIDAARTAMFAEGHEGFPCIDKVKRLASLGGIREISAAVLIAEVYHRSFESRRHVASFIGFAPSPYASGDVSPRTKSDTSQSSRDDI
jgi:transposase